MISSPAEPRAWSTGRWWMTIALVFAVQIAAFQLLENRSPTVSGKAASAPVFRLSYRGPREWFALEDPTLFALPHYQGFSGGAWLRVPPFEFRPSDWSEPARLLSLSVGELGAQFSDFVHTNPAPSFPIIVRHEPRLTTPRTTEMVPASMPSTLRIDGNLAQRRLLSKFVLPAFTYGDLLTNSTVQVLVDARGNTVSAVLLLPGSNSREADQRALELAKAARFEAAPAMTSGRDSSGGLTLGRMIFQWQTLPPPSTNAPPAAP